MTAKPTPRPRLFVINDPYPLRISSQLALEIGFNESILLLQIEYLISISKTEPHEGLLWTYQSLDDLNQQFCWLGRQTINRAIHSLQNQGLIKVANFNQRKSDKTRWFALLPEGISRLKSVRLDEAIIIAENERRTPKPRKPKTGLSQNETDEGDSESQNETVKSQNETTLPKTPTKTPNKESTTPNPLQPPAETEPSAEPKPAAGGFEVSSPGEWNLLELAPLNTISAKKMGEMKQAEVSGKAFATFLAEAFTKQNLNDPVGFAIKNALMYPHGNPRSVFAHYSKELILSNMAYYLARHPLPEAPDLAALFKRTFNLRELYFSLGGEESAIPATYVPPAPELVSAPALAPVPAWVAERARNLLAGIRPERNKNHVSRH